jgi:hypothetical protein
MEENIVGLKKQEFRLKEYLMKLLNQHPKLRYLVLR